MERVLRRVGGAIRVHSPFVCRSTWLSFRRVVMAVAMAKQAKGTLQSNVCWSLVSLLWLTSSV